MTAYDVRARAVAAKKLATIAQSGKGQVVTLKREAAGAYDPATGTTTVTETTQTGSGIVLEYKTFIRSGLRNEPDSLIRIGDKQLLLSALNSAGAVLTPPQVDDRVTIGGIDYTITSIAPLAPAGTVILFECNIRGSA